MEPALFDCALALLMDETYDSALPVDDLLLKLAGAAIGFGLQLGCHFPEQIDRMLFPEELHTVRAFADSIAVATIQERLARISEETGAPPLAVLVTLTVQSYRDIGGEPLAATSLREYGNLLSRFCLRFILMLWAKYPELARHYRRFVPA